MADVLVVGAGLAGARTCAVLRAAGCSARITLVGAEPDLPYDRPPLTKDPQAPVDLREVMGLDVRALADEVLVGAAATQLRAEADRIEVGLSDGRTMPAGTVVLACGCEPVAPPAWLGPRVQVLHTRAQAASFWAAVGVGTRLLVVGGGWIGCEAAATAATRGAEVTLLEAGGQLLPGRVPPAVADRVAGWLDAAGVGLRLGEAVDEVSSAPAVVVAGTVHEGQRILLALGVRPATAWLAGFPVELAPDGSVLTDAWGRSSVPGVFAVGDVAAWWSPRYSRHLPGGHWTDALHRPEAIADAVVDWVGGTRSADSWSRAHGAPADPIPYVFSDIAGRTLQVLGPPGGDGELVWNEGPTGFVAYRLDPAGLLLGACAAGRPREIAAARRAMLADPAGTPAAAGLGVL